MIENFLTTIFKRKVYRVDIIGFKLSLKEIK